MKVRKKYHLINARPRLSLEPWVSRAMHPRSGGEYRGRIETPMLRRLIEWNSIVE